MTEKVKSLIMNYTAVISVIVTFVAPLISQNCCGFWHQPVEPEGLDDFAKISD